MEKRSSRLFHSLQWKLTSSYTLMSVLVWSIVILLLLGAVWWGMETQKASLLFISLQGRAQKAVPLLKQPGGVKGAALEQWLQEWHANESSTLLYEGSISILNQRGEILASVGSSPENAGSSLAERLSPRDAQILQAQLRGQESPEGVLNQEEQGQIIAMVPIIDKQQVLGALVVQARHLQLLPWLGFGFSLVLFLPFVLLFLFCAGLTGVISGALTSRRLVRRFQQLSQKAELWSQGDFSSLVNDLSEDELGQLSRRFNMMAQQLQSFVKTRQELATSQERERMARELHDSVKQQVFALYMQIKGAKAMLLKQRDGLLPRLEQAETLLQQVQEDLAGLIYELRPAGLARKTFSQALQDQLEQWSQQTGIEASFQGDEALSLPPAQEDALYRLLQEALSNIARHSAASCVAVKLEKLPDKHCLVISDNGQGFDLASRTGKGLGLLSMRERLEPFGGGLHIQSTPPKGTTVIASVPSGKSDQANVSKAGL
ncbi:HAMP domain-containing protein [Ktedonosporobacter rubrisoli]|uniref:Oxygen sensor histidine kinase NreB n=1 Tax=Ktedonosporobacter rubrisoli TaxID=2509675 RepID=A0A4V0YZ17_KTERU|nr:ATP-binding protein [Ktedonosporobacter rubrisoli]QBD78161.1 HAMP domain-containing protein [Ktedonosporobacter rubrisoli]